LAEIRANQKQVVLENWKNGTGNFRTAKSMGSGSDGGRVFGTPYAF
jgi:hypothetical protein